MLNTCCVPYDSSDYKISISFVLHSDYKISISFLLLTEAVNGEFKVWPSIQNRTSDSNEAVKMHAFFDLWDFVLLFVHTDTLSIFIYLFLLLLLFSFSIFVEYSSNLQKAEPN
jgi:hypothetical protein